MKAERLGDMAVGAGGILRAVGEQQNRRAQSLPAQPAAQFAPVHVRQAGVQERQVDTPLARMPQPGLGPAQRRDLELRMRLQLLLQAGAQHVVAVDEQEPRGHGDVSRPGAMPSRSASPSYPSAAMCGARAGRCGSSHFL